MEHPEWERIDRLPLPACVVSPDSKFLKVNDPFCELFGYSARDLEHISVRDLTHPEDRSTSVALVDRALTKPDVPQQVLKRYVRRDGSIIWSLLTTTMHTSQGAPQFFISIIEDVTSRLDEPLFQAFAHRLFTVREQERHRLARELHDDLGQTFTALKLELSLLQQQLAGELRQRTNRLASLIDETTDSVRRLSMGLRPSLLDDLGLEAALDWLLTEIGERNGLKCSLTTNGSEASLDEESRIAIFRICQEALNNVVRHAQADQVEVQLDLSEEEVVLVVSDDGIGFDPDDALAVNRMGLLGMRERATLVGGHLEISGRDPGTRVELTFPQPWGERADSFKRFWA